MKKKLYVISGAVVLPALLVLVLILTGAFSAEAPAPVVHTLRFLADGVLLSEQTVTENALPAAVSAPEREGLRFIGWDREIRPAAADEEYHAVYAPRLSLHAPYLFSDGDGLLRPDAPLTGADLASALHSLATEAAARLFPELPPASAEIDAGTLRRVLFGFSFDTALPAGDFPDDRVLTRAEAAVLMNGLLGRKGETVCADGTGFADVSPRRADYADLMEAAVPHTAGSELWAQTVLPTGRTPGWELESGRLRLIDGQGFFTCGAVTDDGFCFDADGWYTSGNEELDAYVTEILAGFQAEHPEADLQELLRLSYDYVRDSFTYLRRNAYASGETGWEIDDALAMFSTARGNCYNYAAAFRALARGLGFDAKAVSGTISKTNQPHGWVEIPFDGETFYFDAETEMAYLRKGKTGYDMFMMSRSYAATWSYRKAG